MSIYLSGVALCIGINVFRLVVILFGFSSTKSKNFRRVKLYYDITTGGYSKQKLSRSALTFRFVDMFLISPLLSWIGVIWTIVAYVRAHVNKAPVPEKIKEVNFKLSSMELPEDKVKACLNEIASFYGYSDPGFRTLTDNEDDDPNEFVFSPAEDKDDWYSEMRLNPSANQYTIYTHSPDYAGQYTALYEYKIDNTELHSRVIESKNEWYVEVDYDIKDNVVLESNVRERMSKSPLPSSAEDIDAKIAELKSEVEWQTLRSRLKYFIMFRHGDIFKDADLKKYFRSEIERLKTGYRALEQEAAKLGGSIIPFNKDDFSTYMRIRWDEELPPDKVEMLRTVHKNIEQFNISHNEFYELEKITNELTSYLNKL